MKRTIGLTCHRPDVDDSADKPALEEEIEVTPVMVAAGGEAMEGCYLGDGRYAPTDEILGAIYCAMERAKPKMID